MMHSQLPTDIRRADYQEDPKSGSHQPLPRGLPWLLLIGGVAGPVAAFILTVEKIALLNDDT